MRVAVYCPPYEDVSGVQEVVRRLSFHMTERGHEVAILARARSPRRGLLPAVDAASSAAMLRVRIERTPHPAMGWRAYRRFVQRFPAASVGVVGAVKRWAPDLIVTHCSKFHAPYVLAMRAALRLPIVVHLHNAAQTADGPASPRLQRMLQRCAARVIAVSPPVAEYARECLPERADRVIVVPNAIDRERFAAAVPFVHDRPYVLGVGRLAAQKGFDVLIDAVASAGTSHDLMFAGDGPDRDALERQARARGVEPRVRFLGPVDRERIASLMRGAAIVAIPSRFEGHPLVSLEAMMAGAPIIATDLPVVASDLRHGVTALLVPVDDVDALAAAIRTLHADPALARTLAQAAREASRTLPTWQDVTDTVVAEYERVLDDAASHRTATRIMST